MNSDDPAYFGGQLNANLIAVQQALDLDKKDILELIENSFKYSLLSPDEQQVYLAELAEFS